MMQLFIEGQEADIDQAFSTLLTASVNDVKSFGTKESTFSKTIILPGTKRNNILFGNIFNTTTRTAYDPLLPNYGYNFNAAVSAKVLVMNQSIQQMKGTIRLLQINVDGAFIDYEVSIVGELGGFSAKMGAAKIEQLDFSAYNHQYSIANIKASWDNANAGLGYYYPLIDYGTYGYTSANVLGGKHNWNYRTFRPAMFVKEYIDKIFAAAGYTYECDLFSTDRFKRLIIPHNLKKIVSYLTGQAKFVAKIATYVGDYAWRWTAVSVGDFSLTGTYDEAIYYNGAATINANFRISLSGQVITQDFAGTKFFELRKNGVIIGSVSITTGSSMPYTFSAKKINVDNVSIAHGDTFSVTYPALSITSLRQITSSFDIITDSKLPVTINLGDTITINDCIPKNILQKDFFASILKLFNLYVYEDPFKERHMIIKPFIDFHNGDAQDWGNLVDRSKAINIKPMSELNARYYEFKYKDDADYWNDIYKKRYNETYGSIIYDSGFEFTSEKAGVELIFAPTPLLGYDGEVKIYPTIFKKTNDLEETIDSVIRIMVAAKIIDVPSWDILGGSTAVSQTFYGYAGHFDDPDSPTSDLNFGVVKELFFTLAGGALNVNQFNVYYSSYMAEITDKDSKMLSCTLRLTKRDWYELSFAKYKWIDGSLWRLNKITDYNATTEDSCKAEFIKLIEKQY